MSQSRAIRWTLGFNEDSCWMQTMILVRHRKLILAGPTSLTVFRPPQLIIYPARDTEKPGPTSTVPRKLSIQPQAARPQPHGHPQPQPTLQPQGMHPEPRNGVPCIWLGYGNRLGDVRVPHVESKKNEHEGGEVQMCSWSSPRTRRQMLVQTGPFDF